MDMSKILLVCFAIIGTLFLQELPANASFHSGGVGSCGGCHAMHDPTQRLHGSDPSSTCLMCHANSQRVFSNDGNVYSPGGDFYWLTQSFVGATFQSPDYTHGHNVIAIDFGLVADSMLATAPSHGIVQYQSSWLGCQSCHDPHGRIGGSMQPQTITQSGSYGDVASGGNYRLLGGVGYNGGEAASGISFSSAAPVAKAYKPTQADWPSETDNNHVDYGSGMSEWCTNCHSGYDVQTHNAAFVHPSGANGAFGSAEMATYNSYVATGDLSGLASTSFDHLVPFERGTSDKSQLDTSSTNGPSATAQVMCLTCHRAHASAFSDIGRWDFQVQNLTDSPVLMTSQGIHAYYGEDILFRYNSGQGQLCEKCHTGGAP